MNSIIFYEQYVLFYYNTIPLQEQVFFFIYKNLFGIYEIYGLFMSIYAQIYNSSHYLKR